MGHVHCQEDGFVAYICQSACMEEVKTLQEGFFAAEQLDHATYIVWHEEHVFPCTAFKGLRWIRCQGAEVGK
jgi:hypothetical protein